MAHTRISAHNRIQRRANLFAALPTKWKGCAVHTECTLHQISPYIGKIKSTIASALVNTFSKPGETIYDPFCGSGTIAVEAWLHGRNCVANDLSPYAHLLTTAKLSPPRSEESLQSTLNEIDQEALQKCSNIDLTLVEEEVRGFFHTDTLQEIMSWVSVLKEREEYFLLAALLGILHHQRPGFLSFPSSHTVPYLRTRLFPPAQFPELYRYRSVRERLQRKIHRTLKRVPTLDRSLYRRCFLKNAVTFTPRQRVDAIITSPPYMRQLDYGRDNRLRLWFLGVNDWKALDEEVSPSEEQFLEMLRSCLKNWRAILPSGGWCVLIVGDSPSRKYGMPLPDAVQRIATEEVMGYECQWNHTDAIPVIRRVRREYRGNMAETVVALRKTG
jgi:hypothetical protein